MSSGKRQGCLWRLRLWEGVFDVFVFGKSVFDVSLLGKDVFDFGRPSLISSTLSKGVFLKVIFFGVFLINSG